MKGFKLKKGKRDLQAIVDVITEAYHNNNFKEMKLLTEELIIELRTDRISTYKFNESLKNIKSKDSLIKFVYAIHMQDYKETASFNKL